MRRGHLNRPAQGGRFFHWDMGRRRKARELAVKVLFHLEFNLDDRAEVFDVIWESFHFPQEAKTFSWELVSGVYENRDVIDNMITKASKNWRLSRMSIVDKCILRLATYEILFMDDIPPKVSIDEAIELGKKFGDKDSPRFINGVLDNIHNRFLERSA